MRTPAASSAGTTARVLPDEAHACPRQALVVGDALRVVDAHVDGPLAVERRHRHALAVRQRHDRDIHGPRLRRAAHALARP
ncbi:hypothetical protein ACIQC8_03330 [Agrococcus sediminis]|uniref:hypothetical protein n=1 Tax=Agrococcus sediminis TaxID=2599924 RepID=UPI00382C515C